MEWNPETALIRDICRIKPATYQFFAWEGFVQNNDVFALEKMKDNWARATWAGQISTAATAEGHKLEFWARNLNTANDIDLDHGNTSLPTLPLAWLNYDLSTTLWHSVDDFFKFVNKTYKIHWISTKFHRMYFATQTQLYLNNSTIFIGPLRYNLVKL